MRRLPTNTFIWLLAVCLAVPASAVARQDDRDRREVEQGREADKQIEAQFGFYDDSDLAGYVTDIGHRMALMSERPTLPWTFRVLDTPVVNAFALPGGFVYVTRGLVAYAGTEAELAGVIGHEIGHVTGRHSRGRQIGAFAAVLGMIVAGVLSDTVRDLIDVGLPQLAASLVLTKYSRGQELDADERGIRYATSVGYNPYGIGHFFETLQSLEQQTDRRQVPGWLSTHPQVDDRLERSQRWAAQAMARYQLQPEDVFDGRPELLAQVDGIVFGENPREGYMDGNNFLHPDLRFRVEFPQDWTIQNARTHVAAQAPDEQAYVKLELAEREEGQDTAAYVRSYLRQLGATIDRSGPLRIHGLDAYQARFTVQADQTDYAVSGRWIEYDGRLYQLQGVTTTARWRRHGSTMERSMESFDALTDAAALDMQPARVAVVEVQPQMTLAGFLEARPKTSVAPATVAILNHMSLSDLIPAGDMVKLVVGGPGAP